MINTSTAGDAALSVAKNHRGKDLLGLPPPRWKQSRLAYPQIPEPEIAAAVLRLYHKLKLGQETVLRPVLSQLQELRERELRSNRKISDIDNEIARISEQNLVLVRLKSKGYVDSALYLSQMDEIDHKLRGAQEAATPSSGGSR